MVLLLLMPNKDSRKKKLISIDKYKKRKMKLMNFFLWPFARLSLKDRVNHATAGFMIPFRQRRCSKSLKQRWMRTSCKATDQGTKGKIKSTPPQYLKPPTHPQKPACFKSISPRCQSFIIKIMIVKKYLFISLKSKFILEKINLFIKTFLGLLKDKI